MSGKIKTETFKWFLMKLFVCPVTKACKLFVHSHLKCNFLICVQNLVCSTDQNQIKTSNKHVPKASNMARAFASSVRSTNKNSRNSVHVRFTWIRFKAKWKPLHPTRLSLCFCKNTTLSLLVLKICVRCLHKLNSPRALFLNRFEECSRFFYWRSQWSTIFENQSWRSASRCWRQIRKC